MPRLILPSDHPTVGSLRRAVLDCARVLDAPEVDLHAFGKALHGVLVASLETSREVGLSSLRFRAAERALDLRTPKSDLEGFVRE